MSKYCVCHGKKGGRRTVQREGGQRKNRQRGTHTHTHTHTHTRHLVTPVQKELVHVVLRIVPAKQGGGRGEEAGKTGRQTDKDREMGE